MVLEVQKLWKFEICHIWSDDDIKLKLLIKGWSRWQLSMQPYTPSLHHARRGTGPGCSVNGPADNRALGGTS